MRLLGLKTIFIGMLSVTTFANATQDIMEQLIQDHLNQFGKLEYFSAIQVSIKSEKLRSHYAVGTIKQDLNSPKLTNQDLFDIGSITKSFTGALAVIAENEGKLDLNKTLQTYVKEYPHWGDISLTKLLDMSSGIPNYSDAPTINYQFSKDIKRFWSETELLTLVYPEIKNPPRKPGYFYSNTGYVLMDRILSKEYNSTYSNLLESKILKPMGLKNTFYPVPNYSPAILSRMAHGYSYNIYDNPELLGNDVTENNLSWAGAAGALVATSDDVLDWVETLFVHNKLLTRAQQQHMQQMISLDNGNSISETNSTNPKGFGLGVAQLYEKNIGRFWFYEGQTLGYRALYMYVPCNKVVVVALFNSATHHDNDHSGDLIKALYQQILKQDSTLNCH